MKWLIPLLCLPAAGWMTFLLINGDDGSGSAQPFSEGTLPRHSEVSGKAILALASGVKPADTGAGSISALLALCKTQKEKDLVNLLATGREEDALRAIQGLAAIGGHAAVLLAAIMNDSGWSSKVRSEAALALIEGGDDSQAKAGIQGLALIGGDENTNQLSDILKNASLAQPLRLQAALDLGYVGTPLACDALISAFEQFSDPDIQAQLLNSLGRFSFPQIEDAYRDFLASPSTPDDLRVEAADSLSNSSPEALPFLKDLVASDRDPEVREMAAWAISMAGIDGPMGPVLRDLARTEPEPDVRRRIYEAMMKQAENPASELLPQISGETDLAARIAGLNAVANSLGRESQPVVAAEFDSRYVPELTKVALSDTSLNLRQRSVFALRRAGTPAAIAALSTIAQSHTPQIAQAAQAGLKKPTP